MLCKQTRLHFWRRRPLHFSRKRRERERKRGTGCVNVWTSEKEGKKERSPIPENFMMCARCGEKTIKKRMKVSLLSLQSIFTARNLPSECFRPCFSYNVLQCQDNLPSYWSETLSPTIQRSVGETTCLVRERIGNKSHKKVFVSSSQIAASLLRSSERIGCLATKSLLSGMERAILIIMFSYTKAENLSCDERSFCLKFEFKGGTNIFKVYYVTVLAEVHLSM